MIGLHGRYTYDALICDTILEVTYCRMIRSPFPLHPTWWSPIVLAFFPLVQHGQGVTHVMYGPLNSNKNPPVQIEPKGLVLPFSGFGWVPKVDGVECVSRLLYPPIDHVT